VRKFIALILLLSFASQTFSQVYYSFDYLIRKAAYEKNCVNKKQVKWECHGKCQLMKKMQEQEKNDAPVLKFASKTEVVKDNQRFTFTRPIINITYVTATIMGIPVSKHYSVFHPPCA
jgi:hypothetical protein